MTDLSSNDIHILPVNAKIDLEINNQEAIASLSNAGDFEDNIFFTFTIKTGDAVFNSKGDKTITVQANPAYVAAARFSSDTTTSGTIEVHPTLNVKLSKSADYSIQGKEPSYLISLSASSPTGVADGKTTDTVTATLKDTNNKKIANKNLIFTIIGDSGALFGNQTGPLVKTTDENGQASVPVDLKSTEDKTVTVRCMLASDNNVKQDINIPFKGYQPPEPVMLRINLATSNSGKATSNGSDAITVVASLADQHNNPVANRKIDFSNQPPSNHLTINVQNNGMTNTAGQVEAILQDNSQQADNFTITAALDNDPTVNKSTGIAFNAASPYPPAPPVPPSPPNPPAPPIRQPEVHFINNRSGKLERCYPYHYNKGDTARVVLSITDQNNNPLRGKAAFIFVQSQGIAISRIVAIQGQAIPPVPYYNAITDVNGNIQVNIAQWPVNGSYSPKVKVYVNFTGQPATGSATLAIFNL